MTEIILFSIIVISFFGYISYIYKKFGILPSISESYYHLPLKLKFLFTLFCYFISIPSMMLGILLKDSVLMLLAGISISFVGATSTFKDKLTRPIHIISAITGIILSNLAIMINFNLLYVSLIFLFLSVIIFLLRKKYFKNYVWWIEILAFLSIFYTFSIYIF